MDDPNAGGGPAHLARAGHALFLDIQDGADPRLEGGRVHHATCSSADRAAGAVPTLHAEGDTDAGGDAYVESDQKH